MRITPGRLRRVALRALLLVVLPVAGCTATPTVVNLLFPSVSERPWQRFEELAERSKVEVPKGEVPEAFPVLVVTAGRGSRRPTPHIVLHRDLAAFLGRNPKHSFLVPHGQDEALRRRLTGMDRFKAERLRDGGQRLMVQTLDDKRLYIGWYAAGEREIAPRHYLSLDETVATTSMPVEMWALQALVTAVVWLVGFALSRRFA